MLGNCYMYGLGIEQDEEEAVKYYQLSAGQGNIPAEYNLALFLHVIDQKHLAEVMGEDFQNSRRMGWNHRNKSGKRRLYLV